MSGARPDKSALRDAATVILLRSAPEGASVLMGMRGTKAAFMPSRFVFPGGAVDAADRGEALADGLPLRDRDLLLLEPRAESSLTPSQLAAAALRELAEETGLLIGQPGPSGIAPYAEAGLQPDASALRFVFRAITPPGRPRRFDARFFVADAAALANDPDDFSKACDELSHLHWVPLREARNLDLPFITEVVLAEVALRAAGGWDDGPVPFFDNRGDAPRFVQLGAQP